MRTKIENTLIINVCGIKLSETQKIEFYLKQGDNFFQYTPQVINDKSMTVTIPFDDAKKLLPTVKAKLQFAFTDNDGNTGASDIVEMLVRDLLKTEGYEG